MMILNSIATTFHGLGTALGLPRSKKCERIFWFSCFFGMLIWFVYMTTSLIRTYLNYNVLTNQKLDHENVPFPSVTICNTNAYKQSELGKAPQLMTVNMAYEQLTESKFGKGQAEKLTKTNAKRKKRSGCPSGYELGVDACYKYIGTAIGQDNAEDVCQSDNQLAHLPAFPNVDVFEGFGIIIITWNLAGKFIHVEGTDAKLENNWIVRDYLTNNTCHMPFQKWRASQPDNYYIQNCLNFFHYGGAFMDDNDCGETLDVVCQIPLFQNLCPVTDPTQICCSATGWQLVTTELAASTAVATAQDCCQICSCNHQCQGFSFIPQTGECLMTAEFPSGANGLVSAAGVETGTRHTASACPPSAVPTTKLSTNMCYNNAVTIGQSTITPTAATTDEPTICCSAENWILLVAELETVQNVSSSAECCDICSCIPDCDGYSFLPTTKECLMTQNFPSGVDGLVFSAGSASGTKIAASVCPPSPVPMTRIEPNLCLTTKPTTTPKQTTTTASAITTTTTSAFPTTVSILETTENRDSINEPTGFNIASTSTETTADEKSTRLGATDSHFTADVSTLSTTANDIQPSSSEFSSTANDNQPSSSEFSSTANDNQPSSSEFSSTANDNQPSIIESSSPLIASMKTAADSPSAEQLTHNSKTSTMPTEIVSINEQLASSTESDASVTQQTLSSTDLTNNYQAPPKICCIAENWMLKNHELDTAVGILSVEECCKICSCNTSCSGFSFVKTTENCYMTSYIPPGGSGVESREGAITGISQSGTSCPPSPIPTSSMTSDICPHVEQSDNLETTATAENQEPVASVICCSGKHFKIDVHELDPTLGVSNAQECCQICKCTSSCEGFSYDPVTQECLMTSNFPSGLSGMTMSFDVVSGVIFKGTVCPASPVPTTAVATNVCILSTHANNDQPSIANPSSTLTDILDTTTDAASSGQMTSNWMTSTIPTVIVPIGETSTMITESSTNAMETLSSIHLTNKYQAPAKICCTANNWQLIKHELETIVGVSSIGDCCQLCSCTMTCSGFSFVQSTRECWMTANILPGLSGLVYAEGTVTGVSQAGAECPPTPIPTNLLHAESCPDDAPPDVATTSILSETSSGLYNSEPEIICCSGQNFKLKMYELDTAAGVESADACCQICRCTSGCEGYSYDPASKECLMTASFPSGILGLSFEVGIVSGVLFQGSVCPESPAPTTMIATDDCTKRARATSSIYNEPSAASELPFSTTSMKKGAEVALEPTTIAFQTTTIAANKERKCCIYKNVGLEGDLPPAFNISNYGECCSICHCTQNCKAFAYYIDKSTCVFTMTQDISRIKMPDPNAVVGGVVDEECSPMYEAYATKIEDIRTGTCPTSTDESTVSSSEITIIGDPGDSCTSACLRKGMKCEIGLLKSITTEEAKSLMKKTSSGSETTFEAWHEEMTNIKHCPFVNSINEGFCPETNKINPICSARPGPDQRRLCPCTEFDSTFVGTTDSENCEQTCHSMGKSCRFDRIFRLSKEEIKAEMAKLTSTPQEELQYQTFKIHGPWLQSCPHILLPDKVFCHEPGDFNPNCNFTYDLSSKSNMRVLCECADIQTDNFDGFCDPRGNDCKNDGKCFKTVDDRASQICVCKPGYSGTKCELANDACRNHLCAHPAICIDHHSHYTCDCPPGKSGKYCTINSNDCEPFPCLVGERCFDLIDGFKCIRQEEIDAIKNQLIAKLSPGFGGNVNNMTYIETKVLPYISLATMNTYLVAMMPYLLEGSADSLAEEMGYSLKDMLLGCYYDDKPCAEWTRQYHPQYGNCYTFNNNITMDPYYVARPGAKYGLQLQLNFDSQEYMSNIESSALKIVFHSLGVKPDPDNEGRSIMPRYLSTFRIKYKMVDALPSPYPSNCIQHKSEVTPYFYKEDYSVASCSKSYMQQKINSLCNCAVPQYSLAPGSNYSMCSVENVTCAETVINDLAFENETEHCNSGCRNQFYTVVDTKSEQLLHKRCSVVEDKERCKILRNIGEVEAFFTSVTIEHLTEVPETTVPQLIASMGGFTGLFVGASVITLVELFYMILYYITWKSD